MYYFWWLDLICMIVYFLIYFWKQIKISIKSLKIRIVIVYFIFVFHRDEFNIKVLQAFVELHEFADLNLVQALRWVNSFYFLTWASLIKLHVYMSHCVDLFIRKLLYSSAQLYTLLCKWAETALFNPSDGLCVCAAFGGENSWLFQTNTCN